MFVFCWCFSAEGWHICCWWVHAAPSLQEHYSVHCLWHYAGRYSHPEWLVSMYMNIYWSLCVHIFVLLKSQQLKLNQLGLNGSVTSTDFTLHFSLF